MPQALLAGRRIAVLRPSHQSEDLIAALAALGATALEYPAIDILPPVTWTALDAALAAAAAGQRSTDWLIFTSANAVRPVADRLAAMGLALPPHIRIAAIGPATADIAERTLRRPDFIADRHQSAALAEEFVGSAGQRALIPCSDEAGPALACALRARGIHVDVVTAYRTVPRRQIARALATRVARGEVDGLVFTSGSTVRALIAGTSPPAISALFAGGTPPATFCIGPATASIARSAGLPVSAVAAPHNAAGLLAAVVRWFQSHE